MKRQCGKVLHLVYTKTACWSWTFISISKEVNEETMGENHYFHSVRVFLVIATKLNVKKIDYVKFQ